MKKIKGLLLFGILTLLGISSSFGMFIDLRDNTGSQLLIPSYTHSTNSSFYNYSLGNSSYTSGTIVNLNNKGIYTFYLCRGSDFSINGITSYGWDSDNGNYFPLTFGSLENCDWYSNPFSSFNGYFDYFYIRNDVSISPYSLRKDGPITRYLYFDDNNYYTYSGNVNDVPSGYTRQKLFLSVAGNYGIVSSDSSGNYLLTSLFDDSFSLSEPIIYSGYILLHFGGYDSDYYNGAGTLLLSLGDNVVYFNYYTGFYKDYSDISLNTPSLKGVLLDGSSSSDGFTKFINLLNNGDKIVLTNGSINGGLSFYSYGYEYFSSSNIGGGYFTKTTNYFFNFQSDNSVPTFITPSGNGNQSTYSGTVSLNNCIDTQICWDYTGSQGDIVRMCTTECVSSGVIASGGYIGSDGTYYFVNSPISIEDSLKTDNPENMFTGSYIESGGILSLSYFTDYFQPGAKKIGVCPFKYYEGPLDFMTKLKVGDVYLLMPVLCFYSAFQQGKNVSFFDEYSVNDGLFSQPLLYGESDNHKLLFAFFDVLFSIGLLGLIRYLSRHLF